MRIEQVGKGAAENWTSHNCDPERAPAEFQLKSPGFKRVYSGGGTLRAKFASRPILRCPFPTCSIHGGVQFRLLVIDNRHRNSH